MLLELVLFSMGLVGGALLATDYRGAADWFLWFIFSLVSGRPNDVLPRSFARGFGALAAFLSLVGIAAHTVNAVTGH